MKKGKNKAFFLIILALVIIGASILFVLDNKFTLSPEEQACINSGGIITTALCCGSVDAFPNTCTMGSCGCSPAASHQVKSCDCVDGRCFNGSTCVTGPL